MSAVPDSLPRGLYLDPSHLGAVIPYHQSPVMDTLALSPAMIDLFAGCFVGVPALLAPIVPAEWMALTFGGVTTLYIIGLLFLLPRGRGNLFPWGPETPK